MLETKRSVQYLITTFFTCPRPRPSLAPAPPPALTGTCPRPRPHWRLPPPPPLTGTCPRPRR